MFQAEVLSVFLYGLGAALSLFAAFLLARFPHRLWRPGSGQLPEFTDNSEVFHLHRGRLVHANFSGRRQLDHFPEAKDDDERLRRLLSMNFNDHDRLLAPVARLGDATATSKDGAFQALREVAGDDVRLEISCRQVAVPGNRDLHHVEAANEELRMLRMMALHTPFHLWRQNAKGEVIWANRNYLDAVAGTFDTQRASVWPIPNLFKDLELPAPSARNPLKRIQSELGRDGKPAWFDCHVVEIDGDLLCTAYRADEAVRSEMRRREFTQTLTKTFGDLAIGLAIFDRTRRLVLFNPALNDLTSLPAEFLIGRPTLVSFLDQLRESRVMPEPRDYRAWRKSISEIETAAMQGTYTETWSLPDGRTYKVSGRPHPDGAMALLLEDITAEMSLTRRFRAQLEQSQAVIDALDDGVAIFSASGELTFSNAAYKELWGDASEESVLGTTIVEATRNWHTLTTPTPVWGDFRDFAYHNRERSEWSAQVAMRDGRHLSCRFVPQKAGASLVIFHILEPAARVPEGLRQAV